MAEQIFVYQLHTKFVNQREDIPEDARQVVYYTLAVGHHVGVMDCFSSLAEIPVAEFQAWLADLPAGPARTKLEGVLRWGEIEVNRGHVSLLEPALESRPGQPAWTAKLRQCLDGMRREPALYLMLRKRPV
ncbi:MAG: formate hydrogenlyase maturation protein HycH [Chloroflexota bacterium]